MTQVYGFTLKGWNTTRRINHLTILRREKNWQSAELDRSERVLQEDRMRSRQEMEELKKLCCTEAEEQNN